MRRKFLIGGALVLAGALLLLLVWGAMIEPRLVEVKREWIAIPGLPTA